MILFDDTGSGSVTYAAFESTQSVITGIDTDGDGIADHCDIDSDNDGITDNVEGQSSLDYVAPSGTDLNQDGLDDAYDHRTVTATTSAATTAEVAAPVDTDQDGSPDYQDVDSDNDGLLDIAEAGHGVDQATLDASGDTDHDGLLDAVDANTVDWDSNDDDVDGAGEFIFLDSDSDVDPGRTNAVPMNIDYDWREGPDKDGDNVNDLDDIDDDNDGILDVDEGWVSESRSFTLNSAASTSGDSADGGELIYEDSDGNQIIFSIATSIGSLTTVNATTGLMEFRHDDSPFDLPNVVITGVRADGNPMSIDQLTFVNLFNIDDNPSRDSFAFDVPGSWSNVDGLTVYQLDASAPQNGTLVSGTAAPPSVDFLPQLNAGSVSEVLLNTSFADDDNGGQGWDATFSPNTPTSQLTMYVRDVEGQFGILSEMETLEIQANAFLGRDTDGDGLLDHCDIDSDNDGITDNVEAQSTAGYIAPSGVDVDMDGLDDAYDADTSSIDPADSVGLAPVDSDGDLTADYLDTDSDNDGTNDIEERGDGQPTSITSTTDTDGDGLLDIFEGGDSSDGFDVNDENLDTSDADFLLADTDNDTATDGSDAVALLNDLDYRDVNETAEWAISGPTSVDEGGNADITVSLTGELLDGKVVTVDLGLIDIDTNSSDYDDMDQAVQDAVDNYSGPGTLTWDGTTLSFQSDGTGEMTPLVIALPITDDSLIEGPEDFNVTLSNPSSENGDTITLGTDSVVTTINDTQDVGGPADGPAEWSIVGNNSVDEGSSSNYTVALGGTYQAGEEVTVQLTLTDVDTTNLDYSNFNTAIALAVLSRPDLTYDSTTNTLTYTAPSDGASMANLLFSIDAFNDPLIEGPEDYSVQLDSLPTSATGISSTVSATDNEVTTTIDDTQGAFGPDDGPAEWSVTGPTSGDEGTTPQYTVALSGQYQAGESVNVMIGLADVGTNSSDYGDFLQAVQDAVDNYAGPGTVAFDSVTGEITFTASNDGDSMDNLLIDLPLTDDDFVEGSEDFMISLSNPGSTTGVTVSTDPVASEVTTTINDTQGPGGDPDGPAQWAISGPASADEGSIAQYTVSLSEMFGEGEVVTVDIGLTDISTSSGDYEALVDAMNDAVAAYAGDGILTFDDTTGTLTFEAVNDGDSMSDLVIDLDITDDDFVEGPEQFNIALSNATSSTEAAVEIDADNDEATTTINDTQGDGGPADGPALWSIVGPADGDEGTTASYTVSLTQQFGAGEDAFIDIELTDIDTNSDDYGDFAQAVQDAVDNYSGPGSLTFDGTQLVFTATADGDMMADLVIDLPLEDDTFIEGAEVYNITLTTAGSTTAAPVDIDPSADDVTTTINDDSDGAGSGDDGPAEWSITGPTEANEDSTATYTIELTGTYQAGEVVTVDFNLNTLDTDSDDYGDVLQAIQDAADANPDVTFDSGTGTLTYTAPDDGASMTPLEFDLPILEDLAEEAPEDFQFELSNPASTTGVTVSVSSTDGEVTTTINNAPVADPDFNITRVDEPVGGNVLTNDTDSDGDPLTVTEVNGIPIGTPVATDHGVVEMNPDGSYTYTPDTGFVGTDTFTYEVCDDAGNCAETTVTIEVRDSADPSSPGDTPPIASDDVSSTFVDTPVDGQLLSNDGDPDGDTVTVSTTPVTDPANGTVVINPDGTYTYTPDSGFSGVDTFEYEICDPSGNCDTATVTINVSPDPNGAENDAPFANDDASITQKNTPISGNALDNDTDPNSDPLAVTEIDGTPVVAGTPTVLTLPSGSTLEINDDGSYTYTPADDFVGTEQVTYTIDDGNGGTDVATIYLSVFDSMPEVEDDINLTSVNEPVDGNVLTNDNGGDPDDDVVVGDGSGNPLSGPTMMTTDQGGELVINPDGTYTYTPPTDFVGEDSITLEVCDENGNCLDQVLTIEVRDPATNPGPQNNTPPIANNDTASGQIDQPIDGNLVSNDGDPDGDAITVNTTPISLPSNGTVVINPDGTYTYTPDTGFTGTDTFEYEICDADGACDTALVTLTISPNNNGPENDPPAANDDAGITQKNVPVEGDLLANDSDPNGDPLTINTTPLTGPSNGTLIINADGTYTYTPDNDFVGNDSFTYEVCDADGQCDVATAYITVFDNPPVAVDDINGTPANTPTEGNVLTNDSDPNPDDDLMVTEVNGQPIGGPIDLPNGTLVMNPDGSYVYTPDPGFVGLETFEYTVCDEGGNCATANVDIEVRDTINPPNEPPMATDDDASTFTDTPVSGDLLSNDFDPDDDPLTVNTTPITVPANGSVIINPDGTYTYTPDAGFEGADSFEYEICDDSGACSTATVTITVAPDPNPGENDPPFAQDDMGTGSVDEPINGDLLANDSDPNNDPLTVNTTPVSQPGNGTVTIDPDGTYTYVPNPGFEGTDSFEYEVCDSDGNCDIATVTLLVTPETAPNAPPIVNDETTSTFQGTSVSGSLISNDADPEGGPVTVDTTPVNGPSNGTIVIHPDGTYVYTPDAGFTGTDTVEYEVCDAEGNCDTAILTVQVVADSNGSGNDSPVGGDDFGANTMNVPIVGDLLVNDSDPNGDPLTINTTPVVGPANGTLVIHLDGTYTYTPDENFVGNDSFVYEVCDEHGACVEVTVSLVVFAQPPTATPDLFSIPAGQPALGDLLANDSDPDANDSLTINTNPLTQPENGTVVINPDGTFTYTPDEGFTGVDTFEYEVCDETGNCDTAWVTVAIADVTATKDVIAVIENGENWDVTFLVTVKNTGGTQLTDLTIMEDIAGQFGSSLVSSTLPVLDASGMAGGTAPMINAAWTSDSSLDMLDPGFTNELLNPNEYFTITFTVTVDPDATGTSEPTTNQVEVTAVDSTNGTPQTVTDLSDSGTDPESSNPGEPGDTGGFDDATLVLIGDAGVAKAVVDASQVGAGFDLTIQFVLENTGTAALGELTLFDDLASQYGDHFGEIVSTPTIINSTATVDPGLNAAYAGDTSQNMLDGTGILNPGEFITVELTVRIDSAGTGTATLQNQAVGGGTALQPDGTPVTNPDGSPMAPVTDLSDSGLDPNGNNPGEPGDTGGTADPTTKDLLFYTFDSFNEFSNGFSDDPGFSGIDYERPLLTTQISSVAAHPIYSGSARPGTRIVGRIYDQAGHLVAESMSFADLGGNWMMQMQNSRSLDHYRIEFIELVGQGETYGAYGDIYGYLGVDHHTNDYNSLQPWALQDEPISIGSIFRGLPSNLLDSMHRENQTPLGFGSEDQR